MSDPLLPSEVRQRLLEDHECIKAMLDQVDLTAEKIEAGMPIAARFVDLLGRLRRTIEAHNASEERHLEALLATVDAWGPIRREQMVREHIEEHIDLLEALDAADPRAARALVTRLRAHMAREESTFLNSNVLRDDTICLASCS